MNESDVTEIAASGGAEAPPADRDADGRFVPGNPHRWTPGRSGNPTGRPKGASFAAALARQAAAPAADREEMVRIARMIGLDTQDARNIDVVASLFYMTLCRALVRAASGGGRVDERMVGMLQLLLKALDGNELRISGPDGGAIPVAAVVANVQAALGMLPASAAAFPATGEVDAEDAFESALPDDEPDAAIGHAPNSTHARNPTRSPESTRSRNAD